MTTEQANDPLCHCKHHESSHKAGSCNECICSGYWHFTEDETNTGQDLDYQEQKQGNSNTTQQEAQEPSKVEQEISMSFTEASFKLDKIESDSNSQKSEIIQLLAVELEGKIATDEIANEIVEQLCRRQKKVSERLVRHCLNEKYKKKHRVDNAKKQKVSGNVAAKLPIPKQSSLTDKELLALSKLRHDIRTEQEKVAPVEPNPQEIIIDTLGHTVSNHSTTVEDLAGANKENPPKTEAESEKQEQQASQNDNIRSSQQQNDSTKQHETQEHQLVADEVVESVFLVDWDRLQELFVPNMNDVNLTIKTSKDSRIFGAIITNRLSKSLELKNGGDYE